MEVCTYIHIHFVDSHITYSFNELYVYIILRELLCFFVNHFKNGRIFLLLTVVSLQQEAVSVLQMEDKNVSTAPTSWAVKV